MCSSVFSSVRFQSLLFQSSPVPHTRRSGMYRCDSRTGERMHYQLDNARTLVQCCNLIRYKKVRFFQWDGATDAPLLSDFLSLTEDMVDSRLGSDVYTIIRDEQAGPDDFAHSVNMGVCALFWRTNNWPNMAELAALALDPEILRVLAPTNVNWEDFD